MWLPGTFVARPRFFHSSDLCVNSLGQVVLCFVKQSLDAKCIIQANARRIVELRERIQKTYESRHADPRAAAEWSRACEDFRRHYDDLAFPGGYEAALQRIAASDAGAIDVALAFIEVRPYFYRSQYIRTKLIRLLKRATLTDRQVA